MVGHAEEGKPHRFAQNAGGLKRRSELHLVSRVVRVRMGITHVEVWETGEWLRRNIHSQWSVARCSVVVIVVRSDRSVRLDDQGHVKVDPSVTSGNIEREDLPPEGLSQLD